MRTRLNAWVYAAENIELHIFYEPVLVLRLGDADVLYSAQQGPRERL